MARKFLFVADEGDVSLVQPGGGILPAFSEVPTGDGSTAPIPTVLVVDPNGAPTTETGAWSGTNTFTTLQAAMNALGSTPGVIWMAPGGLGALAVPSGAKVTVRGFGGQQAAFTSIDSVTIDPGAQAVEFVDCAIVGAITDGGGEVRFVGTTAFRNVGVLGSINHNGLVFFDDDSAFNGTTIQCQFFFASTFPKSGSTQTITPTSGNAGMTGAAEYGYFSGGPDQVNPHQFAPGTFVVRTDDTVPTALIGPDSVHTIADTDGRIICQPGTLTAARIWTITKDDAPAFGVIVDVWGQAFDLTIMFADTTLVTVTAGSRPQRLFFFSTAAGDPAYVGQQFLV